ncbi:MAG: nucleotidyltransferase family protein [Candidatus Wolfebacteria bacterium]|nr:nucleotidyltransferase family protein [Candidatus Wolfebacteria bacterium]
MQAVILAAGEGLRLKPVTETIPKCLLKVGKKTILENTLFQLPKEVGEVIIVVGHLKSKIKSHIGNNWNGRNIKYVEQTERLGTGHALFTAKDSLRDGKFIVLMGDNLYLRKDVENCLRHDLAILAQKIENPERFGIIKTDGNNLESITETQEVSQDTLINCGLYVLDKRIFDYPMVEIGKKEYGLPQTIAKMAKRYPVVIEKATFWMPINDLQDLKQADKYIKQIYL